MRYCFNCRKVTTGEPLFCAFCGRTYNVKLCPRLHINPRNATVCSQCGSHDLSIPEPRMPAWLKPLTFGISLIPGFALMALTIIFILAFIHALLRSPAMELELMLIGFVLALLWYGYMHLPSLLRSALIRAVRRKGDRR